MNPFQISPEEIVNEIHEFNAKLAKGFNTLSDLDEIKVGVSEKEAIYKEDKLVLYHYSRRGY